MPADVALALQPVRFAAGLALILSVAVIAGLVYMVAASLPAAIRSQRLRTPFGAAPPAPLAPRVTTLAAVLREIEANRGTAHIHVESGGAAAELFLLLGRLYHAEMAGWHGDGAALRALRFDQQTSRVDVRLRDRMPTAETVTLSLDQLLNQAARA